MLKVILLTLEIHMLRLSTVSNKSCRSLGSRGPPVSIGKKRQTLKEINVNKDIEIRSSVYPQNLLWVNSDMILDERTYFLL